ncbi:MAG: hypothetical protein JO053_07140 [Acidobacteria bacterium]|nr:hypothetical protein [Acidobacteriota bacterium]
MNIGKRKSVVQTSFEFTEPDDEGQLEPEVVEVGIKRLSFKDSVSKEFLKALENLQDDPEQMADVLPKLIVNWNVTDIDETGNEIPFPISAESFRDDRVSPFFVVALSEKVMSVIMPNPQKPASSAGTSAPTDSLASAAQNSSSPTGSQSQAAGGE